MFAWILCCAQLVIILALAAKIILLKKGADEICAELKEYLAIDTNTLIFVSSGDKYIRHIADELNKQLRLLRKQRRQYLNGSRELNDAVLNISHDLRTPLTAICGYLDLLKKEEKNEDVAQYLSFIENRTEALKQLIEELFRYSVIVSSWEDSYETVVLNQVLEDNLLIYYAALTQQGIEPEIEITDIPIYCQIDLPAFNRIVGNIISNVLKYSDGDLSVKLFDDGTITFTNSAKDLTPVMVERLFDRFYTTQTGQNSTGLGLSIAKILTEHNGGKIHAIYQDRKLSIVLKIKLIS